MFFVPRKISWKIYKYEITLDEAIEEQAELKELINKLNDYGPRIKKKTEEKNRVLKSAEKFSDARDDITDIFREKLFPYKGSAFRTKEEESEEESEENKLEKIKDDYRKLFKYIEDESMGIKYNLFKEYFDFEVPTALAKTLYETKDEKKNNDLVK